MRPKTHALIRRPSARLAEGELTHVAKRPVELRLALQQHGVYCDVLARHGLTLVELPELPEHPDGLFVEDVVVMLEGRALLTRPGALSRRGEVESVVPALERLQVPSSRIHAPATLDGGDVLVLERHVLVGRSSRSNDEAIRQLETLITSDRQVVGIDVHAALHLKTAVTCLPDGSLIAVAAHVDLDVLRALGYRVHETDEPSGGNVLCLGETVLLPADAARTGAPLAQLGFTVEHVDMGELQKLEAGLTCLSVLF